MNTRAHNKKWPKQEIKVIDTDKKRLKNACANSKLKVDTIKKWVTIMRKMISSFDELGCKLNKMIHSRYMFDFLVLNWEILGNRHARFRKTVLKKLHM